MFWWVFSQYKNGKISLQAIINQSKIENEPQLQPGKRQPRLHHRVHKHQRSRTASHYVHNHQIDPLHPPQHHHRVPRDRGQTSLGEPLQYQRAPHPVRPQLQEVPRHRSLPQSILGNRHSLHPLLQQARLLQEVLRHRHQLQEEQGLHQVQCRQEGQQQKQLQLQLRKRQEEMIPMSFIVLNLFLSIYHWRNVLPLIILADMIKLYWNVGSQPARAVKVLLELGKIPHEAIEMDLKNNQTRTPEFLKLNPLGQIPFIITTTGLGIGESNAIMQYLCQKYPEKLGEYYGAGDLTARTKINTVLSWYQSYFRPALFGRIRIKYYGTIKKGIPHTESQLEEADKVAREALAHLQNFLKQHPFVTGESPNIADLLLFFETTNLIYYDMQPILKEYDRVSKWYHSILQIHQVKQIHQKWRETVPAFQELMASAKPVGK